MRQDNFLPSDDFSGDTEMEDNSNESKPSVLIIERGSDAATPCGPQRKLSRLKCVLTLVHTAHCKDRGCPICPNMKRIVAHVNKCTVKQIGKCLICRQYVKLCSYHARECQNRKCSVVLCLYVKKLIREKASRNSLMPNE